MQYSAFHGDDANSAPSRGHTRATSHTVPGRL